MNGGKFEASVKKLQKSVQKILKNVLCSKSSSHHFFCSGHTIFSIILPLVSLKLHWKFNHNFSKIFLK